MFTNLSGVEGITPKLNQIVRLASSPSPSHKLSNLFHGENSEVMLFGLLLVRHFLHGYVIKILTHIILLKLVSTPLFGTIAEDKSDQIIIAFWPELGKPSFKKIYFAKKFHKTVTHPPTLGFMKAYFSFSSYFPYTCIQSNKKRHMKTLWKIFAK